MGKTFRRFEKAIAEEKKSHKNASHGIAHRKRQFDEDKDTKVPIKLNGRNAYIDSEDVDGDFRY